MRDFRKNRVIRGPVHNLSALQAAIRAGSFHAFATSARRRVIAVFGCSQPESLQRIQAIIAVLRTGDYARTVRMDDGIMADEYGVMYEGVGWYVKLRYNADDQEAEVCSCHLPRFPITTRRGVINASDTRKEVT